LFPTKSNAFPTALNVKPFITSSCTLEGYSSIDLSPPCSDDSLLAIVVVATAAEAEAEAEADDDDDDDDDADAAAGGIQATDAANGILSCDGQGRNTALFLAIVVAAAAEVNATAGALWSPVGSI